MGEAEESTLQATSDGDGDGDDETTPPVRPVTEQDFHVALTKVKRTGQAAEEYASSPLTNVLYI